MGTWGAGGFENDEAADWIAGVGSLADLTRVLQEFPADPTEEIDADQSQRAIAAAECVAAMLGRPAGDAPADLVSRLVELGEPEVSLVEAARNAVSRLLGSSQLIGLWAEEGPALFNLAISGLIERLNPDVPYQSPDSGPGPSVLQVCGFCDGEIEERDRISIEVRQLLDPINQLSKGFWCHLSCLNARLHPGHLVQNWKFDPAEIERGAGDLLKG